MEVGMDGWMEGGREAGRQAGRQAGKERGVVREGVCARERESARSFYFGHTVDAPPAAVEAVFDGL